MRAKDKCPNGKLCEVDVELVADKIGSVKITGDFFIHPEEGAGLMENSLMGVGVDEVLAKLNSVVEDYKLELVGVTTEHVASLIRRAICGE
jgi:lipoate-protein ligase A